MSEPLQEQQARRDAILDAAEQLFAQFGYRRTAMDDVARRAGVAKGTLYLYFDGKVALFRAMQSRNAEAAMARCAVVSAAGGSLQHQLLAMLEAVYGVFHVRYGASDHLSELSATRQSVGGDLAARLESDFAACLAGAIAQSVAVGVSDLGRSNLDVVQIVAALLSGARGAKYEEGQAVSPDLYRQRLDHLVRLTVAAISA